MSSTDFYRAFEERYRGSRDVIKERLKVYQATLDAIKKCDHEAKALDLGCGRGEWLELLDEQDFNTFGVDLDEGMLEACQKRGLRAEKFDAIEYLEKLDDESLNIITGFHIAEHLPFETLQKLIKHSLRALKPGGILILETPNPENIVVAGNLFYLDPSHLRPIPTQLLSFSAEHAGFMRLKVLRLQEDEGIKASSEPTLWDVLEGASPDYAILAQKEGPSEIIQLFDDLFGREVGLKPQDIATRFDQGFKRKISELSNQFNQLKDQTELQVRLDERAKYLIDLEKNAKQLENRAIEMEVRLASALTASHEMEVHAVKAEVRASEQEARAQAAEARASEQEINHLKTLKDRTELEVMLDKRAKYLIDLEKNAEQHESRAIEMEVRLASALTAIHEMEIRAVRAEAHAIDQEERANLVEQLQSDLEGMRQQAKDWHEQIIGMKRSVSWQITGPLRMFRKAVVAVINGGKKFIRFLLITLGAVLCLPFLPIIIALLPFVLSRGGLRNRLGIFFYKYPRLRFALRLLAFKLGLKVVDPRLDKYIKQSSQNNKYHEDDKNHDARILSNEENSVITTALNLKDHQHLQACNGVKNTINEKAGHKESLEAKEDMPDSVKMIYEELYIKLGRPPLKTNTEDERPIIDHRGQIKVLERIEAMNTSQRTIIPIALINKGNENWRNHGKKRINVSYKWMDDAKSAVEISSHRTNIPGGRVLARSEVRIDVLVEAPSLEGIYYLKIIPVEEGVKWFDVDDFESDCIQVKVSNK